MKRARLVSSFIFHHSKCINYLKPQSFSTLICRHFRKEMKSTNVFIPIIAPVFHSKSLYSSFSTSNSPPTPKEKRENIYTIPNALTLSRIVLSPVIGVCIMNHSFELGLGLLIIAGITDALDGWIARKFNMKTAIGSVLDPAADKILMTCLVVSLSHAQSLPLPLGIIIIGRDVLLAFRTAFYRYQTLPEPKTWNRYWDLALISAEVQPPLISKVNTVLQLALMAASLASSAGYGILSQPLLEALQYMVATTTIWSGLHYFVKSDTIKLPS